MALPDFSQTHSLEELGEQCLDIDPSLKTTGRPRRSPHRVRLEVPLSGRSGRTRANGGRGCAGRGGRGLRRCACTASRRDVAPTRLKPNCSSCPPSWPRTSSTSPVSSAAPASAWGPQALSMPSPPLPTWTSSAERSCIWALHAVLVKRPEDFELYDQAFRLFWRDPQALNPTLAQMLPHIRVPPASTVSRRIAEAWRQPSAAGSAPPERVEFDAALTFSADEVLRTRDFDQMSAEEFAQAKKIVARLTVALRPVRSRRFSPDPHGAKIDLARTVRESRKTFGDLAPLRFRSRVLLPPPLVVLCDISGSMGRYSEMLLQLPSRPDERPLPRPRLPLRHPADQRDAHPPPPRPGRSPRPLRPGGSGLVRRNPPAHLPARLQPLLVAPRPGTRRRRFCSSPTALTATPSRASTPKPAASTAPAAA